MFPQKRVNKHPRQPPSNRDPTDSLEWCFSLPTRLTSLMQPVDHGIIATFRAYYLQKTSHVLVKTTEDNNMTVKNSGEVSPSGTIMLLCEAWKTCFCMHGARKKLCPYLVYGFMWFNVAEICLKLGKSSGNWRKCRL
jgi:hypothetical protein